MTSLWIDSTNSEAAGLATNADQRDLRSTLRSRPCRTCCRAPVDSVIRRGYAVARNAAEKRGAWRRLIPCCKMFALGSSVACAILRIHSHCGVDDRTCDWRRHGCIPHHQSSDAAHAAGAESATACVLEISAASDRARFACREIRYDGVDSPEKRDPR
jgi:hypothetical protein